MLTPPAASFSAKSARIAAAAQLASQRLDADRAALYFDLIMHSSSEAARKALQTMNPAKYEYRSDFAKHYFSKGKAEGGAQGAQGEQSGRAALVTRLLTVRFGEVIATRMFCQDRPTETALLAAMKSTAAWRISGSPLELLDANQTSLARFEARNL